MQVIGTFKIEWPEIIKESLFSVAAVLDFDVVCLVVYLVSSTYNTCVCGELGRNCKADHGRM